MTAQAMKRTLRQSIIAGRAALPEDVHQQLSREITARLLQIEAYQLAHTVMGYMHFGAEFVSEPWLRQVLNDGKQLLLPKVNTGTRELEIFRVEDLDTQLAPGAYDIREPLPQRCMRMERLEEIDFMLLPGVAFTRHGARLGYGGGFYDKLLARMDGEKNIGHGATLAAAAFAMQLVEDVPQESTDRKVEWLVTENETIHCAAHDARK
jgi:5-formyltetrahydrofolate cyclo-ligase